MRKRIGELLVERGVVTRQQLDAGLALQKRTRLRLGATLIQMGALSEGQLAQALGESLGAPVVNLQVATVDWSAVHLLRARFCETHDLFPYALVGKGTSQKALVVAMADPLNQPARDEIEFTTGLTVSVTVAPHSQVREAISRYYHKQVNPSPASQPGRTVAAAPPVEEEPAVVLGEEIIIAGTPEADPELESLIAEKAARAHARRQKDKPPSSSKELDFLFGDLEDDPVEKLERKFWALMRLMARKGLITREEFTRELDPEE